MKQITASELKKLMDENAAPMLVDVREGWERDAFNIGGLHIPMAELMAHVGDLPMDREVVLYCEKGIRSVIAIQRLESVGFQNLVNLSGGMKVWKEQS